jgi:LmbE family N-acetylglucosaminyl deacetylase
VAAHPDDEILGCGGTMARLSKEGHEIFIVILGEGETSRGSNRENEIKTLTDLKHQSLEASQLVGAKELFTYNFPDNRFDTVALLEIVKKIEEVVTKVKPHTIFTHHGSDLNVDHQICNRAVLTATRPVDGMTVKEIYAFEIPSSSEWSFQSLGRSFRGNYFVDISETLDTKIKAMECYRSEIRNFPHPRSTKALHAISTRWGSVVGCKAAEAFEVIRSIY